MHFRFSIKMLLPIASVAIGMLFISCIKDNKDLGGQVIPDDYTLGIGTARIYLPLESRVVDSIQAISTTGYLGAIRTPELGLATFYFGVNYCPSTLKFRFGTEQIIKDCRIELVKTGMSTADKSQEALLQNFHIYRMTRSIDTVNIYNTGLKPTDYIPQPIEVGGLLYAGQDTLRAFLNEDFARSLLNASQWALDSTNHFIDEFKGLLFTCDSPEGNGGRLNAFTVTKAYIQLTINYQPTWKEGLPRKDTTFQFLFGVNNVQNFSSYESEALQTSAPTAYIPVEGIGGIKPFLNPLKLKDSLTKFLSLRGIDEDRFIIARARFYLPFTPPADLTDLNQYYPAYLFPCYKYVRDEDYHKYYPLEDVYTEDNNHGLMNRSLGCYYGDISSWVQHLVLKNREDIKVNSTDALWFSPLTSTTSSSYSSSSQSTVYDISTSDYVNGRINGQLHANPPYVEIVYTILPKN